MINLLPPGTKDNLRYGHLNVTVLEYSILILVTAAGLIGILFFGQALASNEERQLKDLAGEKQAVLAQYDSSLAEARALDERIDIIAALLQREITFSKLLPNIGALVPSGTTINGLELDNEDGNNLTINGESDSQLGPSVFRQNLANTDRLFSRADIVNISLPETQSGPNVYNFQIDVQFAAGAKQELKK